MSSKNPNGVIAYVRQGRAKAGQVGAGAYESIDGGTITLVSRCDVGTAKKAGVRIKDGAPVPAGN